MRLVAIFESWHVGDGNYAPFDQYQTSRLAFEVDNARLRLTSASASALSFKSNDDATCEFCAEVLGRHNGLTAFGSGEFRFYIHDGTADQFERGSVVRGEGTLALDHYAWFENVGSFINPPDLYFDVSVVRIRKVRIPERFVDRYAGGKYLPTTVEPGDYTDDDVEELTTMRGQAFDEEFYLVDFETGAMAKAG